MQNQTISYVMRNSKGQVITEGSAFAFRGGHWLKKLTKLARMCYQLGGDPARLQVTNVAGHTLHFVYSPEHTPHLIDWELVK